MVGYLASVGTSYTTGDKALHTSMYPLSKEFGDLCRLEEGGDRSISYEES